jgi:hypothetical protein
MHLREKERVRLFHLCKKHSTCVSLQLFDDEAREIRARVDSLLRRVHVFVPRAVARYSKKND